MGNWGVRIGLGTALFATALGAACSSETSCEETRTCSSSAGSAGAVGADASTDAPIEAGPQCTKDEDCDDGSACTGTETCSNGTCTLGKPVVCSSPDPAHCTGVCQEVGSGQTECTVEANDNDGDFHGDALCTATATLGDDCDDSNVNVHGTAKEICDGVDNDCNGKADLFDGLPLGGTNAPIVVSSGGLEEVDVVWSETAKVYGIVWRDFRDGASGEIYFTRMDSSGNEIGDDVRITNDSSSSLQPRIAASGTEFAIVWGNEGTTGELRVQRLSAADGQLLGSVKLLPEIGQYFDIIDDGSGGWIAAWSASDNLNAIKLQPSADPIGPVTQTIVGVIEMPLFIRLARSGSVLAMGYAYGGWVGKNVRVDLRTAGDLAYQYGGTGFSPADPFAAFAPFVMSGGGQFLATWGVTDTTNASAATLAMARLSPAGVACDNASLVTSTSDLVPRGAAFDGKDFAIAYLEGDLSGMIPNLRLIYVDMSCNPTSPPLPVSSTAGLPVALGDDGQALALFSVDNSAPGTLLRRIIPASRCD